LAKLRIQPPPPAPIPRLSSRVRIGKFDRIVIDKVEYMSRDAVGNTVTLARADNPDVTQTLSQAQLLILRHSRGYRHDRDFYNPEVARARMAAAAQFLRDLEEEEQEEILWKKRWCLAILEVRGRGIKHGGISFTDEPLQKAIDEIAERFGQEDEAETNGGKRKRAGRHRGKGPRTPPGPKCLRGWIKELIAGDMNPLALRNDYRKCGNHDPKIKPDAYAFLWQFARMAATPEKPDATVIWPLMKSAIAEENRRRLEPEIPGAAKLPQIIVPSYNRLLEEINEIPFFDMLAGQEGIDKAKNYVRAVNLGLVNIVRPLQRVEFDEWTVHLHVLLVLTGVWDTLTEKQKKSVEKIRLVLCLAIDVATKCVVGMSLAKTACPENALRCLECTVSDKQDYADAAGAVTPWDQCGIMEAAVADAGTSFANFEFRARVVDLGIIFKTVVAGLPFLRGTVERVFRSTDGKFVALFAGRTFSDSVEKGDYDSEGRACLTIDEFAEALVRYKIDHYHNQPHEGLGGETPRSRWLRLTEDVAVDAPPDDHLRRVVFGIELHPVLGAHGVRVLGIDYQSAELNDLFARVGHVKVDVRVDQRNLGGISAKIGDEWIEIEGASELFRVTLKDWVAVWDEFQAQNAQVNKITAEILDGTMNYLSNVGRIARERRNIATEPMTEGELRHHQRRMSVGVKFVKQVAAEKSKGPVDLYDGALAIEGDATEPGDPSIGATASPGKRAATAKPKAKATRRNNKNVGAEAVNPSNDRRIRWNFEE
jgi:putative transposase